MVVKNRDESHGTIRKTSPTKQIQDDVGYGFNPFET